MTSPHPLEKWTYLAKYDISWDDIRLVFLGGFLQKERTSHHPLEKWTDSVKYNMSWDNKEG